MVWRGSTKFPDLLHSKVSVRIVLAQFREAEKAGYRLETSCITAETKSCVLRLPLHCILLKQLSNQS